MDTPRLHDALNRRRSSLAGRVAVLLLGGAAAGEISAQGYDHDVGTVDFAVSCGEPARVEFNRAVALLHHVTYPRAHDLFQRVARIDPQCAMAHWGIAMTLFQPLWPTRPSVEDRRRGWRSIERARSLSSRTERERLLVDAAAAFFKEPDSPDYWQRLRHWEQAMESAHAAFPQDVEIASFYALAHLAVAPSDATTQAHAARAAALLLAVLERNPRHPGAMHYLVHANDAQGRERESLDMVRAYESVAPRNPHALHMPTHIYVRLGDWDAVIRGNLLAAEAALGQPAGDRGQFVTAGGRFAGRRAARATASHRAAPAHLQDRVPPGLDSGPPRAGAGRLARSRFTGGGPAVDARLGSVLVAGSGHLVCPRLGCGSKRASG